MHSQRSSSVGRRGFLRGALAGAALAPVMIDALASRARADGPAKALFVYVPDGCIPSRWHASGTGTSFTLPAMSAPLERIRAHATFLDGLDMYAGGATHEGGCAKVLTGNADTSLDVYLGQELRGTVPHASVHLGVGAGFENGSGSVSRLAGANVMPDDDPLSAFDRLFGGRTGGGGSMMADAELALRRRRSVLDAALGDLASAQRRLGRVEARKLEVHLDSLRGLERRIVGGAMPMTGASCEDLGWNAGGYVNVATDYYPRTYHREDNFLTVGRLQQELAVLALACGMTRVATVQWSHPVSPTRITSTGSPLNNHDASHFGDPMSASADHFVAMKRWFMERFVELIERMAATPEGSGTLLDSTIVVLVSELGDSNAHDHRRVPFVVVGGAGGRHRGGRALDFRGAVRGENDAHTKLLVSVAHAVGVPITSYGYTGHGAGPLEGLLSS